MLTLAAPTAGKEALGARMIMQTAKSSCAEASESINWSSSELIPCYGRV
jgi:hypothetical protein